jgi:hypothetical protein
VSDRHHAISKFLRAELAGEVAAGFPRLRPVPQTEIIWFLDYFAGLPEPERETLLDALADSAAYAFLPPASLPLNARGTVDVPPAIARMVELRQQPGGMGGTRYMDIKMQSADPSFREPGGYHPSWREKLTPLHFQPRPDLLPDINNVKPAKAPQLRKLVKAALSDAFELRHEKQPGGTSKFVGPYHDGTLTIYVHFGMTLGQLKYDAIYRNAQNQPVFLFLTYNRLWGLCMPWNYITEDYAERSAQLIAEQIAYLVDLSERLHAHIDASE